MPDIMTQTAPANQVAPAVQAPEVKVPQEDLVTRASKVSLDTPKKADDGQTESIKLDQASIDRIADPVLKASVQEAYKSMQADYTRKTQELANQRKSLEQKKGYDIPSLLNDPEFVRAAQDYSRATGASQPSQASNANGELTEEEFSYLSPEQQKLYTKTKQMEQTLGAVNQRLQASEVEKQDMSLRSKYANYDPQVVNDIYNGMMSGTIQATREHLFKVADYDSAVQRAYKLGLEDRNMEMKDKISASSPQTNGVSVTAAGDTPARLPKESGIEYFKRIATHNASKLMKK